MKFSLTLVACALALTSTATVHTITCQNGGSHFLPVTVNAVVGDTILWTWISGVHVVGPISLADIPAGAQLWDVPIDASYLSFEYVVNVPGVYHYVCHPANPHGEDGYINVSTTTSVPTADHASGPYAFYPNPFQADLNIEAFGGNRIVIHDLLGGTVATYALKPGQTKLHVDLADLPKGVFFGSIMQDDAVISTKRLVKN
ncbi:MAG: T9SS type A sorting domain-containing protein [Flavobacteriales bacterium]